MQGLVDMIHQKEEIKKCVCVTEKHLFWCAFPLGRGGSSPGASLSLHAACLFCGMLPYLDTCELLLI